MYKQHKTRLKVGRRSRCIRMWANYNSLSTHAINAITRSRRERGRQYLTRNVFYRQIHKSDFTRNERDAAQLRSMKTKDLGSSNGKREFRKCLSFRHLQTWEKRTRGKVYHSFVFNCVFLFLADNIRTRTRVSLTFRTDG